MREPRRESRTHVLPIEACTAMFDAGRYADVVSLGSAGLELHAGLASVSGRSDEAAALNALIGHAKKHLGDRDGARAAFALALRAVSPSGRSTYVQHVVELARDAASAVSADDTALDADAVAAQARELLESAASVDDALGVAPGDVSLEQARTVVREALAIGCERLVTGHGAGDGGHQAHALVLRALADESMPAPWRTRLGERLTPISSAEIGQLTAQAIRCVQEGRDADAVDALRRAERLFAALPAGTVPDERLEEFERRLWWGYTKLGLSRIDTRHFEEALEPLFHALTLGGVDADRLGETRGALVGAMESLVDEKSRALSARGADGIPGVEIDKLDAVLRSAVDRGVGEDELGDAFAKLLALRQALARAAR